MLPKARRLPATGLTKKAQQQGISLSTRRAMLKSTDRVRLGYKSGEHRHTWVPNCRTAGGRSLEVRLAEGATRDHKEDEETIAAAVAVPSLSMSRISQGWLWRVGGRSGVACFAT